MWESRCWRKAKVQAGASEQLGSRTNIQRTNYFRFPRTLLVVMALLIGTADAVAAVSVSEFDPDGSLSIGTLTGGITDADVRQLARLLPAGQDAERFMARQLTITSSGGDWNAAMLIGRILRKAGVAVFVDKKGCHSACVLVLAGGASRIVFGPIGIHRPYTIDVRPRTYADAQQQYRALEAKTKLYLEEMNLPTSLFDAMVRVPPESIRELSKEEVVNFGLEGVDPVTEDRQVANQARKYGLDRRTYYERIARRDLVCAELMAELAATIGRPGSPSSTNEFKKFTDCRREVMEGKR